MVRRRNVRSGVILVLKFILVLVPSRTVSKLSQIIVLIFGHFAFLSPLLERGWRLWTTYTVHLRLIVKLVVDFLFVLIELFR